MKGEIIRIEGASYMEGFIAKPGLLCLTSEEIQFSFHKAMSPGKELLVSLKAVDKVDYFKSLSIIPNGLTLFLKDGEMFHFIVDDRVAWQKAVEQACRSLIGKG